MQVSGFRIYFLEPGYFFSKILSEFRKKIVALQEDPQSIVANVTAATAVLIMVYNILTHGENNALQTDFSTQTIRMQTVLEKKTRRRAA